MTWWDCVLQWAASWDKTQGFWTGVQGIGTVIAAVAALVALFIAKSQLSELIRSNKLLADSNDAMSASNVSLTRPYVIVDFAFHQVMKRDGGSHTVSLALKIENTGRTPAKNLTLSLDRPFDPEGAGRGDYTKQVGAVNKLMDGASVIKTLTPVNPIIFYIGDSSGIDSRKPDEEWTITAKYEDAEGREFVEEFTLALEHWKLAIIRAEPLQRIAKNIEGLTYELKTKPVPKLVIPPAPKPQTGRPRLTRATAGLRRRPR